MCLSHTESPILLNQLWRPTPQLTRRIDFFLQQHHIPSHAASPLKPHIDDFSLHNPQDLSAHVWDNPTLFCPTKAPTKRYGTSLLHLSTTSTSLDFGKRRGAHRPGQPSRTGVCLQFFI
jgi:hypothetical protein